MSEKDLKSLCVEHGLAIQTLITLEEGNGKKLDKILEVLPTYEHRITVVETIQQTQPKPKLMMLLSTIGGAVSFAGMWFFRKLF